MISHGARAAASKSAFCYRNGSAALGVSERLTPEAANGTKAAGSSSKRKRETRIRTRVARVAIPAPREASDEPQEISAPDLGAGKSSCQTWG